MTVVLAVRDRVSETITIVSDDAADAGAFRYSVPDKTFRAGDFIVGFAGDSDAQSHIQAAFVAMAPTLPDDIRMSSPRTRATRNAATAYAAKVVLALRAAVKGDMRRNADFELLLIFGRHMVTVDRHWAVLNDLRNVAAVGIGSVHAIVAVVSAWEHRVEPDLKRVMNVVRQSCPNIGDGTVVEVYNYRSGVLSEVSDGDV